MAAQRTAKQRAASRANLEKARQAKKKGGKLTAALAARRAANGGKSTRRKAIRVNLDAEARSEGYTRKTLNDFMRTESRNWDPNNPRGIIAGGSSVRKRKKGDLQRALRSGGKIGYKVRSTKARKKK